MVRNKGPSMGIFNHPWSLSSVTISLHLALIESRQIRVMQTETGYH